MIGGIESSKKIREQLKSKYKSLRFNMAEKANEIVMKNHTWKNRAEQIVNML